MSKPKNSTIKFRKGAVCRAFDQWGRLTRYRLTVLDRSEGYTPNELSGRKVLPRVSVRLGQSTFHASVRVKFGVEYIDLRDIDLRVVAKLV